MQLRGKYKRRQWVLGIAMLLLILFGLLVFIANRYVTPMLRSRLHTLIIQGSDSLYKYELGSLDANFFGGNVAVENLHIQVDSSRYRQLDSVHALPSLTMQLDLEKGYIKGLSVFRLLFSKRIEVTEIGSRDANIRLSRHIRPQDVVSNAQPLWKALQPTIKGIKIDRINLDGVKLLYRNADTSEAIKLQFDRCVAIFDDVRIDSLASTDTSRIAFTKNINLHFSDLKFRTPDSVYKMKAETILYSSKRKYLEVVDFKLQPTLKKEEFYQINSGTKSMYNVEFDRAYFTNLQLDRFIHSNIIVADSAVMINPELKIYNDKTLASEYVNKYGTYPHQKLLHARTAIDVKYMRVDNGLIQYTEKGEKSGTEGVLDLKQTNLVVNNVTNLPARIKANPVCTAVMDTKIFTSSPLRAQFTFYLDSIEGEFAVNGEARNITAAQLNRVAIPLGNTELTSGTIHHVQFALTGDEFMGRGRVNMRYNNFSLILRGRDEETGAVTTKKFLTKLINRFTLHPDNPGPDGVLRQGRDVVYARPSTKPFFATVWKTLFIGMEDVMLKSGMYR